METPTRIWIRTAALSALLLALFTLASLRLDRDPAPVSPLAVAQHPAQLGPGTGCRPQPLAHADGSAVDDTRDLRMNSNSYLTAYLCEPTRLSTTAEGSAAGGVGARLIISLGTTVLFDSAIQAPRAVSVEAPEPGWLVVSFANDLYQPPADRNLRLTDLTLTPVRASTKGPHDP